MLEDNNPTPCILYHGKSSKNMLHYILYRHDTDSKHSLEPLRDKY
jgi:hypothetical protein